MESGCNLDCTLVGASECTLGGQTSILSWASAPLSTWRGTWDFGRVICLSAEELVSSGLDWHSDSRVSVRGGECEIPLVACWISSLQAGLTRVLMGISVPLADFRALDIRKGPLLS